MIECSAVVDYHLITPYWLWGHGPVFVMYVCHLLGFISISVDMEFKEFWFSMYITWALWADYWCSLPTRWVSVSFPCSWYSICSWPLYEYTPHLLDTSYISIYLCLCDVRDSSSSSGGRDTMDEQTPSSSFVATASADGTAKLWDIRTSAVVRTYQGHQVRVY